MWASHLKHICHIQRVPQAGATPVGATSPKIWDQTEGKRRSQGQDGAGGWAERRHRPPERLHYLLRRGEGFPFAWHRTLATHSSMDSPVVPLVFCFCFLGGRNGNWGQGSVPLKIKQNTTKKRRPFVFPWEVVSKLKEQPAPMSLG